MLLHLLLVTATLLPECGGVTTRTGWQLQVIQHASSKPNDEQRKCLVRAFATLSKDEIPAVLPQAVSYIDLRRPLTEADRMGLHPKELGGQSSLLTRLS